MRCNRAQSLMDRYAKEGLPRKEQEPFEAHLRVCPECRQQLANLHRLVERLRTVPSPPVPHEFVEEVMARARREREGCRVDGLGVIRNGGRDGRMVRWAKAVAATAAGLLLGLVLGQQTWWQAGSNGGTQQPGASVDTEAVYSLDYLSGTPRGSFTESYLSLTGMTYKGEG